MRGELQCRSVRFSSSSSSPPQAHCGGGSGNTANGNRSDCPCHPARLQFVCQQAALFSRARSPAENRAAQGKHRKAALRTPAPPARRQKEVPSRSPAPSVPAPQVSHYQLPADSSCPTGSAGTPPSPLACCAHPAMPRIVGRQTHQRQAWLCQSFS